MDAIKNLRVGTRLGLAFAILLALLLGMAAVGAMLARSINFYAEYYPENILPSLRVVRQIDAAASTARRFELRHLIVEEAAEKKAALASVEKARSDLRQRLKDYELLVSDDQDRSLLKKVGEDAAAFFAVQDKVLKLSDEGQSDPTQHTAARTLAFEAGLRAFDVLEADIVKWWDYNEKISGATTDSAVAVYQRVLWIFAGASVVALVIGVLAALAITRSITGPLQRAAASVKAVASGDLTHRVTSTTRDELGQLLAMLDEMTQNLARMVSGVRTGCGQINVAAAEIAQGNGDLSARTESQASNLEETAASVEQMAAQIKANADNARQADQLANHASEVAQAGGVAVGEVVKTMDAISESSRKISDIIGTIDGIAFQTNILALNAAVEAARAGEQGRGFAVVAGEVRTLAQRSAEAAKEIKSLIGDSVSKVESGSTQVLAARETIEKMVNEVRKVTDLVGEITVSSREQSEGVTQINAAVSQLDQATQQNAALVEETAAAAESMRQQTDRLNEAVSAFRVDSGEAGHSPKPAPKPAAASKAAVAPKPASKPKAKAAPAPRPMAKAASTPKPVASPGPAPAPAAIPGGGGDWETF